MISKKFFFALSLVTLIFSFSCANQQLSKPLEDKNKTMNNQVAYNNDAHNFTEIQFSEGSFALSDNAKSSLQSVISQAKSKGEISDVYVLSWADQNFPSKNVDMLPPKQRDLADHRNLAIRDFLRSSRNVEVNTFNMAERPSSYSRIFDTDDNELKNSFLEAGLTTTQNSGRGINKASRSVILVKLRK